MTGAASVARRGHKWALWSGVILAAALAAGGGLWLTARRIASPALPAVPVAPEIQARFEQITLRGRARGGRRWTLEADRIEVTRDQSVTRLEGVRRAVLYSGDQEQLTVRARWALLHSPSRDMELGGGVEVQSPGGLALRTASLRWRAKQERLDSGGPIEMSIGDTTIQAPRAYYSAPQEQIICTGGVRIRQADNYLSGARLTADLRRDTLEVAGEVTMRLRVAAGREFSGVEGPLGAMKTLLEKAPQEVR